MSGVAVALTVRMQPRGMAAVVGIVATLTFVLISSVLFFMSFDSLVPFYSAVPEWLCGCPGGAGR